MRTGSLIIFCRFKFLKNAGALLFHTFGKVHTLRTSTPRGHRRAQRELLQRRHLRDWQKVVSDPRDACATQGGTGPPRSLHLGDTPAGRHQGRAWGFPRGWLEFPHSCIIHSLPQPLFAHQLCTLQAHLAAPVWFPSLLVGPWGTKIVDLKLHIEGVG